jgi:acyl-CoA thioester hydrolase
VSEPHRPEAFEQVLRVEAADIDTLGHVNNVVYLRWVQDIAAAHWRTLAPQEDQATLVWVVMRHEIDYKHPAGPGDEIALRTWVGEAEGLRFERHTEVLRRADGKLLARARTVWCPIDARTGRPRRVSPEVRGLFSTAGEGGSGQTIPRE